MSLLLVNYWKELSKYIDKKRYIILIFVIICQVGLFFVLKLYFFEKFTSTVYNSNTTILNATINSQVINNIVVNNSLLNNETQIYDLNNTNTGIQIANNRNITLI